MEDESGKPRYAYLLSNKGLVSVKIFNIEHMPEFEEKVVLHDPPIPEEFAVGMFSHSNKIYFIGGRSNHGGMRIFDHNKFQRSLSPSIEREFSECLPMVVPSTIPAGDKTYFIYDHDYYQLGRPSESYGFQSFDATKNCFVKLPNPPFKDLAYFYGHFLLHSFLYLFVLLPKGYSLILRVFIFDTVSQQWQENQLLASQFTTKEIPPPIEHRGDLGLSKELFDGNTRIMVALNGGKPIAYLVHDVVPFEPLSYRCLEESFCPCSDISESGKGKMAQLADFGGGKFCVAYGDRGTYHLVMYVFHIDFEMEHKIQTSGDSNRTSSKILSSRKFEFPDSTRAIPFITSAFCFLSADPAFLTEAMIKDYILGFISPSRADPAPLTARNVEEIEYICSDALGFISTSRADPAPPTASNVGEIEYICSDDLGFISTSSEH